MLNVLTGQGRYPCWVIFLIGLIELLARTADRA
jgi:hypothetical protein